MNPFGYLKTHWHAMAIGAAVWYFVGPYVVGKVMSVTAPKQG
jgi:hypothetical protein